MDVDTYFSSVVAGFEFLIALGSLIGVFGLVVGALPRQSNLHRKYEGKRNASNSLGKIRFSYNKCGALFNENGRR